MGATPNSGRTSTLPDVFVCMGERREEDRLVGGLISATGPVTSHPRSPYNTDNGRPTTINPWSFTLENTPLLSPALSGPNISSRIAGRFVFSLYAAGSAYLRSRLDASRIHTREPSSRVLSGNEIEYFASNNSETWNVAISTPATYDRKASIAINH